jgi:hypothetical protein
MKLVKQASGKTTIKMSKSEWLDMGKKAGWMKEASISTEEVLEKYPQLSDSPFLEYVTHCVDVEDLITMAKNPDRMGDNELSIHKAHINLCPKCSSYFDKVKKAIDKTGHYSEPGWIG